MPLKDSTKTKMGCQKRRGVRVGEGQSLVLKTSILKFKIKESGGKRGELPVPGSPVTGFPGTTRILRMGFQLSTFCFEILRRVALWRAQYDESCKLCSGGSYCLSLASMLWYALSFMDVDKILPSSSTLGWPRLQVKGEVQTRKGLWWIPRHPETRKGVVSDEMLRGVENKHRSEDSRIGQPFELLLNSRAGKRQPGELKHLSSQRKRKQKRFP
ncbi:hypothetical protein MTR_0002s0250 [Medicago truncatula]|uniref:Uncharacterized protein n=2 Tax=Medicago truncatula TaxID=3880 RepID=A0A072TVZ8_MEDTR|nr:hypothetical protein MTR_0002s0250 [Medicago truncatula]